MIVILFQTGFSLFGKRWRILVEQITLLIVVLPIIVTGPLLADYIHLAILYPYYSHKIAQTSERPVTFVWGDQALTVLDGLQMRTLLYDETGATSATSNEKRNDEGLCTFRQHLIRNFFIQTLTDSC